MVLHSTDRVIITPSSSQYDLNTVERDAKHHIIIYVNVCLAYYSLEMSSIIFAENIKSECTLSFLRVKRTEYTWLVSTIFHKGDHFFITSCLLFCTQNPFGKKNKQTKIQQQKTKQNKKQQKTKQQQTNKKQSL